MQIKTLTPDEIVAQLGEEQVDFDSDLCRQVRELLTDDMLDNDFAAWSAVIQPTDADPFFIELDGINHLCDLIVEHEACEACFLIPCLGAIEHAASGESAKHNPDYDSHSPTMQFLKELNSSGLDEAEKAKQLRESWLKEGFVMCHAAPQKAGCWLWVQEHGRFVFGGMDANLRPGDYNQNPFQIVHETILESLCEKASKTKWEYLEDTVHKYIKQKEDEGEAIWRHPAINWYATSIMLANVELVVRELDYGYSARADLADVIASRESYRLYREAIMGGISMFTDLLSDRDSFSVCMSKLSPKGLERAWNCITERVADVSKLMKEVDERHAKKSGANN